MEMAGIDIGEAQVILLAKQKGEREVLIDERNAREAARHLGMRPRGTIFVILTAVRKRLITKRDAKDVLANLIEANFHMGAMTYHRTLETIEEL